MTTDAQTAAVILAAYCRLPDTPRCPRRRDRRLAERLVERGVPVPLVEAAFLLATARRQRHRTAHLPPIRSLHYFLPIIEEVLRTAPDHGYVDYLRRVAGIKTEAPGSTQQSRVDQQRGLFATSQDSNTPPARVQKKPFLRDR